MKSARLSIFLLHLFIFVQLSAQPVEDAKSLYLKGDYEKAIELANKTLKIRPKDANLHLIVGLSNYQLGDYKASEKALQLAAAKSLPEALYYLGEMQYKGYRFAESVDNLSKYIAHSKADPTLKAKAEIRLPLAQAGARLMKGVEKVQVIDSLVVDKANFLSYYHLSQESGKLKQGEAYTAVYQNQKNDKLFFSQKTASKGYDLFTRSRLMDAWGDTVALSENVNSAANENFPYVLSDGVTLYFSSDRVGTMGGCDLFITRYNLTNDSYLTPENIGMPFNSIFNDYMLAIDEQNNIGWFASDRYQPEGKVVIYMFIPNEIKRIVEGESFIRLIQLAQLHAIKQTWQKGLNYAPYLAKIKELGADSIQRASGVSSFRWVLNDRTIYYSWNQFRNEEAKASYLESLKTKELLVMLENELNRLRKEYAASDSKRKGELSASILATEKQAELLQIKENEQEQKARKLEMK